MDVNRPSYLMISSAMIRPLFRLVVLAFLLLQTACADDDSPMPPDSSARLRPGSGVLVLNEGPFRQGLASLSFYHFEDGRIEQNLFERINGYALGDVLNSALVVDTSLYLLVNNSSVVERVGLYSLVSHEQLDLPSPRYALELPDGDLYITDFSSGEVARIETAPDLRKSNQIATGSWSEHMQWHNGRVWFTSPFRDQLYAIDPASDRLVDSIQLESQCGPLVADNFGRLWTLCSGSNILDSRATLYRIDPTTRQHHSWPAEVGGQSRLLAVDERDEIWMSTSAGVVRIPVQLSSTTSIPERWIDKSANWYALGRNPQTGNCYLGDARDFQRPGIVYRFDSQGTAIDSFEVGIGPNSFLFY